MHAAITDCLSRVIPYGVAYIQVRRLRRVVEALGHQQARKVLNWIASTIVTLQEKHDPDAKLGFLAPDLFVSAGTPEGSELICLELIERFDADRKALLKGATRSYFIRSEVSLAAAIVKDKDLPLPTCDAIRAMADELLATGGKIRESVVLTSEQTRCRPPRPNSVIREVLSSLTSP
jgi:hypothetical protein